MLCNGPAHLRACFLYQLHGYKSLDGTALPLGGATVYTILKLRLIHRIFHVYKIKTKKQFL